MNCKGCILAGIALLLVVLLALGVFTITAGHFLATEDAISQADGIVVLGGDGDNFFRVQQGVELFNEGYAPLVVFSGGVSLKDAGLACSSAQLSLEAAQQLGLPADATIIADGAQSTYDEAVNIRRLAQQHGWRSLILVTDLFHTRRAARTFRALLPHTTIYVSAAPDPRYHASRWWQNEHSLVAVVNEVLKLGFYWAKYGITPVGKERLSTCAMAFWTSLVAPTLSQGVISSWWRCSARTCLGRSSSTSNGPARALGGKLGQTR